MQALTYWGKTGVKIAITLWLFSTGYDILTTNGNSFEQKTLNYFDNLKVQEAGDIQ